MYWCDMVNTSTYTLHVPMLLHYTYAQHKNDDQETFKNDCLVTMAMNIPKDSRLFKGCQTSKGSEATKSCLLHYYTA